MKKILAGILVLIALVLLPPQLQTKVEGTFTQVSVKQVEVTSTRLAMRTGAGTTHTIIKYLPKGTVVQVLGKVNTWYVIKTSNDGVGCVSASYVKPVGTTTPTPTPTPTPAPTPPPSTSANSLAMQQEMLSYVNASRATAGLSPLTLDASLSNGAYLKSKDMADNNYFSHTSPTYGSPFDMMKSLGITYMSAGENIAKNTSVKGAHDAFMNSSGHKANILGTSYKKAGFGFVQEGSYLYVTQWFTS